MRLLRTGSLTLVLCLLGAAAAGCRLDRGDAAPEPCPAPAAETIRAEMERTPLVARAVVTGHPALVQGSNKDTGLAVRITRILRGTAPSGSLVLWPSVGSGDVRRLGKGGEAIVFAMPFTAPDVKPTIVDGAEVTAYLLQGLLVVRGDQVSRLCRDAESPAVGAEVITGA